MASMRSAQASGGSPIETQMSVYTTSASLSAVSGSVQNSSTAPVSAAISWAWSMSFSSGKNSSGAQATKCMPSFAQPIIRELPML